MRRVVILGRGGSGKSTLAARLARITGLPLVELDKQFWSERLTALPPTEWAARQRELVRSPTWILDGDLGPYDVLDVRLRAADTVLLLDFSLARCAWRAVRRSRERADFWLWLLRYRRHSLPAILGAIGTYASGADLRVLCDPRDIEGFLGSLQSTQDTDSSSSPSD